MRLPSLQLMSAPRMLARGEMRRTLARALRTVLQWRGGGEQWVRSGAVQQPKGGLGGCGGGRESGSGRSI